MSDLLVTSVRKLSRLLTPIPTGEEPRIPKLSGIRSVVFDVYGTLLVSASGDISLASEGSRGDAALAALASVEIVLPVSGDEVVALLHAEVHASHSQSSSDHPEVEIRECWSQLLAKQGVKLGADALAQLAVAYECRVNPVWPMPGLEAMLDALRERRLEFGMVSNAQFFTPLAMNALMDRSLADWGFLDDLSFWSYEHREAKPGIVLYERCAEALAHRGIEPREVLYVGNDLRNDVWPAGKVGFRTALFAGDARSLRWRKEDPAMALVTPDAVITDLLQLLDILA